MSKTPTWPRSDRPVRIREELSKVICDKLPEDFTDYLGHPLDLGDEVLLYRWGRWQIWPLDACSSGFMIRQPGGGIPINPTYVQRKKLIRADKAHDLGLRFP